jgi:hypothetical protein
MEAFKKLTALCPHVEPSTNEFNWRAALPTTWRTTFAIDKNDLLKHCTTIRTHHEDLFDINHPKLVNKGWGIWTNRFFMVYCAIHFPFSIYEWQEGRDYYPEGYDDNGEPIGKQAHTLPQMTEFCSPQHLTLVVHDGIWDKAWGLKDWHTKADEISNFCNNIVSKTAQYEYQKGLDLANKEVEKWEKAIAEIQEVKIPNAPR